MQNNVTENASLQKPKKHIPKEKIKLYAPLCIVLICALITASLLYNSLKSTGNIDGVFVLSGASDSSFIKFDSDGSYQWSNDDFRESGNWDFENNNLVFTSSEGNKRTARFVDQKYVAPIEENFLLGEIPVDSLFDAEVLSETGEAYAFKADGKVYTTYEGRNTEYGTYIRDGHFIIITTLEGSITYLDCGDGITSIFYKAS